MDQRARDDTIVATPTKVPVQISPIRGPLKLEVTTSSPALEAGRDFSLLVTITNPFDIPVEVERVTTIAPVEFIDIERIRREGEKKRALHQINRLAEEFFREPLPTKSGVDNKKKEALRELILSVLHLIPVIGSLARVGYSASQLITASSVSVADSPKDTVTSILDVEKLKKQFEELQNATAEEEKSKLRGRALEALKHKIEEIQDPTTPTILQPGNSIVHSFTLCTTRTILFPPSSYELPLQLEYKIAGVSHRDSFRHSIVIRSPLKAAILGAMIGACAGFLLKDVFEERAIVRIFSAGSETDVMVWLIALMGNVLLAVIVVIAFARKRDTQPILSIEDFWGGLFVGAMTGYAGKAIVNQILSAPTNLVGGKS
jgi:hypothetical protein